MEPHSLSRWQQFYLDDPKLGIIPPSSCADQAVKMFNENNSQIILDLGCGTGRDSLLLASGGVGCCPFRVVAGLKACRGYAS